MSKTNKIFGFLLIIISVAIIAFAARVSYFFGNLTPEQLIVNIQTPLVGTASNMFVEVSLIPISIILIFAIIFGYLIFKKNLFSKLNMIKIGIFLIILAFCFTVFQLRLFKLYYLFTEKSNFIEQNYKDIKNQNPKFPMKKRNLIHIYLESFESSYFKKELGGNMDIDIVPDLEELIKEGIHFSNTDKFGGAKEIHGSSWSVAGMVNMTSGIPMKVTTGARDYGRAGYFLPGVYNLGDLLNDNGYEQTIMFGADADFGGLSTYYKNHGNFNIFDIKYVKKNGILPKDYNVWWGFEDEKLFEFAKNEILRLYKTGKPFNFTIENADTHFPDGYMGPNTKKEFENQYANVIKFTQKQLVDFVRWIQKQQFYENTTIVLTGDHLSMDKKFFKDFDKKYDRRVFNLFLNSAVETNRFSNREFAPLDLYPTILASLGIKWESERAGLGTNLFSNEKTFIEEIGYEKFNGEIEKFSDFYNEKLAK